jgi:hypothetical protein
MEASRKGMEAVQIRIASNLCEVANEIYWYKLRSNGIRQRPIQHEAR